MKVLQTIEELADGLCSYCSAFDYGASSSWLTPNRGVEFCEGSACEQAYEEYLEEMETTHNIVMYATKVKLLNKGDYE